MSCEANLWIESVNAIFLTRLWKASRNWGTSAYHDAMTVSVHIYIEKRIYQVNGDYSSIAVCYDVHFLCYRLLYNVLPYISCMILWWRTTLQGHRQSACAMSVYHVIQPRPPRSLMYTCTKWWQVSRSSLHRSCYTPLILWDSYYASRTLLATGKIFL